MKKFFVATLLLGTMVGGSAFATSAVTVDFLAAYNDPIIAGVAGYTIVGDYDLNGAADYVENRLVQSILADVSQAHHNAVHAAWDSNFAGLAGCGAAVGAVFGAPAGFAAQTIFAGGATRGETAYVIAVAGALGIGAYLPATFDTTAAPFVGKLGDADDDGITNGDEYTNAGGDLNTFLSYALTPAGPTPLTATIAGSGGGLPKEVGTSASWTVTAGGGTGEYTYQWQFDNGGGFADIAGATGTTYSIPSLTLANSGSYRCVVDDGAGLEASNVKELVVVAEGSLPVAGLIGLGLLTAACAGAGVVAIRRKK